VVLRLAALCAVWISILHMVVLFVFFGL